LALLSAATFSTSGSFAASLLAAGWSPGAAVTTRIVVSALVLTVPAVHVLRGRWSALRDGAGAVIGFGVLAVAGCQLFFFNAVERLSVGVALLLEYLGTVLVVGWMWARHGQRPRRLTLAGAGIAMVGLVLVLGVTGSIRLDPVGVLWGLAAATGLAAYFVLSARVDDRIPPLVMAWGGMVIGGAALSGLGVVGVLPMRAAAGDVVLAGYRVSWLVPTLGLSLIAAVVAYVTGIGAARRLGPRLSSFVGLTEVVFAVLFAWVLLGQLPLPSQILGGVVIVVGVSLVRLDELRVPDRAGRPGQAGTPAGRLLRGGSLQRGGPARPGDR
jgi:drug/metabolite transporter (DMT)-like permease